MIEKKKLQCLPLFQENRLCVRCWWKGHILHNQIKKKQGPHTGLTAKSRDVEKKKPLQQLNFMAKTV